MGRLERRAENLAAEFSLMIQDWGVCFWEEHWLWKKNYAVMWNTIKLWSQMKYS